MVTINVYDKGQVDDLLTDKMDTVSTSGASEGDVLTLDANLAPAWQTPSGGGLTRTIIPITSVQDLINNITRMKQGGELLLGYVLFGSGEAIPDISNGVFKLIYNQTGSVRYFAGTVNLYRGYLLYQFRITINSGMIYIDYRTTVGASSYSTYSKVPTSFDNCFIVLYE